MTRTIDSLHLPFALRELSDQELETVCAELREELIASVAESGGHFASSLGATEISVALHTVFETPADRLVWDVGHQGYIHKMLTGRRELLSSIRQSGGISGFLKRDESEFDTFGAGHAGTSISAAVGMALALKKTSPDRHAVAIIVDGSLTAGMAFEALNHAGALKLNNLTILLNDNEMSISPNVGALSWLFSRTVTGETSTAVRKQFKEWHRRGYIPEVVYKAIDRAEEAAVGYFSPAAMLFESFGFRYIGPVDGHSVSALRQALENAKRQDGPVIVHARTRKGKGFEAAEADPLTWHGVNPFDREKAEFRKASVEAVKAKSYTAVFSETLLEIAKADPRVVGITAAMPTGTGLDLLERELPEQFLDVGICEQHAVTCAAGMACEGLRPVCAIYSTFLQRGFDQVLHDVCIQNLPVVFALDRAGAVGNDGETHQGLFDISFLRAIPNLTIVAPRDEEELRHLLYSSFHYEGPVAIRYPRGTGIGCLTDNSLKSISAGTSEILVQGEGILFIGLGPTVYTCLQVSEKIHQDFGVRPTVLDARFVKPLDEEALRSLITSHDVICTVEDHSLMAGFGSAVLEFGSDHNLFTGKQIIRFGAQDTFTPHSSQKEQYRLHGYDVPGILARLKPLLANFRSLAPSSSITQAA
ncbi:MAG: 1-deoxy-D-xylulose-5-phosphate synthase [Bdellovibrionales bacterium]|nr:1-deoxy-D-xylulose-5-phosphate synthase [Bdellovibrionales bacterium]